MMMAKVKQISLPHNWTPRDYQWEAWRAFEADVKRFALVWHRRAGKDDFALRATSVAVHKKPASYWHMLPEASQARKAIWEAVNSHTGVRRIDEAFPDEICTKRENDMVVKFHNGSMWHVVGSDNYDSLVGSPPAGVVFSEWPLAKPEAWAFLRPILLENDGWAMFLYTPRGPNHGMRTYDMAMNSPEWFAQKLTVDDTGIFTSEQLAMERREMISDYGKDMGEALYQQEYYCSFEAAVIGAIYGSQIALARASGRITSVPYDPNVKVGTMWDLGFSDSTSIWFFQLVGNEIRFIDYYAANNVSLKHYAQILEGKTADLGYQYDSRYMLFPHDVEVHELSSGKSRRQILFEMGISVTVSPKAGIWDGIEAVRREFHRFVFDRERCEKGIEALSLYQREWDPKNRVFLPKPKHDWTSHAADAMRTGIPLLPDRARSTMLHTTIPRYARKKKPTSPPSAWSA
jgi:hypothetical protein